MTVDLKGIDAPADRNVMATRRFVRKAEEWTEVARWLGIFWPCRCQYSNVASYRCYYCGKRAPAEVRTLVANTVTAAHQLQARPVTPEPVHVAGPQELAARH